MENPNDTTEKQERFLVIKWRGKPSNYDTHLVERIWFQKNTVCFVTWKSRGHISTASIKEIEAITPE